MVLTRYEPLSEERRGELLRKPNAIHHRRTEDPPTPYEPEIWVTGDIDTLELLGRRDDEDSYSQQAGPASE